MLEKDSLVQPVILTSVGGASPVAVASGATYRVRYRARNVHGWSTAYSPELTIIAATVPSAP